MLFFSSTINIEKERNSLLNRFCVYNAVIDHCRLDFLLGTPKGQVHLSYGFQ